MIRLKEIGIIVLLLLLVTCNNQGPSKKINQQDSVNQSLTTDTLLFQDSGSPINVAEQDIEDNGAIWEYDVKADSIVQIKNPEYLIQQMGSSGAFEFMVSTTFTLTELSGIKCVSFDFQEGDHASPGTYSRKYYWDWIKENRKLNKN